MRKYILLLASALAFNEYTNAQNLKTTFDPVTSYKDEGGGFYVDFDFSTTGLEAGTFATNIILNSIKIDFDKGYYRKFYSKPAGKFYKCSQLNNLCAETFVIGFWIHIVWLYNGATYENGGQFTGMQRSDKYEFVNVTNAFTPPSEIPSNDRKNAVIKKITVSSCSIKTEDKIEDIIYKLI